MNIFDHYRQRYEAAKDEEFTLQEFLTTCRQDRSAYANAAERLSIQPRNPDFLDSFLTGSLHVIRRLKSFTAWKTRLNRLYLI